MLARSVGCLLLVLVALDVFRTVLLPSARGMVDRGWVALLWGLARLSRLEWAKQAAGPLSVALTVATWVVLLWLAFALLYLPVAGELSYGPGLPRSGDLGTALYLSATSLTTLGLGDLVAQTAGLRLLVGLQGACGLALFTAALGYLPALYTVVSDLRTSAESVSDLRVTSPARAAEVLEEDPTGTLDSVRRDVTSARQHLLRFPVLHWFHPPAGQSLLALFEGATLLWVVARLGLSADHHPAVQRQAQALELALLRLVQDAQRQVGGAVDAQGREAARALVQQAREAVRGIEPQRPADGTPPDDVLDDLARAHSVMRRYAQAHGWPVPTAF